MTKRFILIDQHSGYIFADVQADDAKAAAQAADRQVDPHNSPAEYVSIASRDMNSGYQVYEAPVDFPEIDDGQDQDLIDRVDIECAYVASLQRVDEFA